jgi:hypothetical protein
MIDLQSFLYYNTHIVTEPGRVGLTDRDHVNMLSPRELIRNGIETERLETIPLANVLTEEALIDDSHAVELGASMKQKRGQITPIAVRPRIDAMGGGIVYDVIDGFHRSAGKKINGDRDINATVIYGCSDEEMFDLRILAASSVRSVQFARLTQWMTKSFDTTPWAKKGMTVTQAFQVALKDQRRSNVPGIGVDDLADIKDWAKAKTERWGKTVGSVYQDLRLVANADPTLVSEVRTAAGGYSRETTITQSKLAMVVNSFPGDGHHAVQRAILHHAVESKWKIDHIEAVCEALKGTVKPGMSEESVRNILKTTVIEHEVFSASKSGRRSRGTSKPREQHTSGMNLVRQLRGQIAALEEENARLSGNSEGASSIDTWWRNADFLSEAERRCVERILYANLSIEATAQQLQVSPRMVTDYLVSALRKRNVFLPHQKPTM